MAEAVQDCPVTGWQRIICQRKSGKTAGKFDVYFISPEGKRLRSRPEVSKYLREKGLDLSVDLFCFKPCKHNSEKTFTKVKHQENMEQNWKSSVVTQSGYFNQGKDESEEWNSTGESLDNSCKCRDEAICVTQDKIQTSPYFNRNIQSPKALQFQSEEKMFSSLENKTDRFSSTENELQDNLESVPFYLEKTCLPPKPVRLCHLEMISTESTANACFETLPPGLQKCYSLRYIPPKSPFNLIQEELYHDPWKLLVATIFLNKTSGLIAIPVLRKFFEIFPDAKKTSEAHSKQIEDIIQPLGLFRKRAQILIRFSTEYFTKMWQQPNELFGIGKYGNDSFRIFCLGEYQDVFPDDHKLNLYHSWLCEKEREAMSALNSS